MIAFDPLYGRIEIPPYLSRLAVTPEVRRLSQIRLLNTASPTVATLGELRRYSHTLGVLHLFGANKLSGFSAKERMALGASVLVHDVGTPPFGHLFEYHLREHTGWSHEAIANSVLAGAAAPENRAQQIFAGRALEFKRELVSACIPTDTVGAILAGQHPLSRLLFGTVDFDNIDNIGRMAWALGLAPDIATLVSLAAAIGVSSDGELTLAQEPGRELIGKWAELRRRVYEIVVFDTPTVAAQAVLSQAMERALRERFLSEDDWSLTDEELLAALRENVSTKDSISEYWGPLPHLLFWVQVNDQLDHLFPDGRTELHRRLESIMAAHLGTQRVLGYSFEDRGTFEKSLRFSDPSNGEHWTIGTSSRSVILYGFSRSRDPHSYRNAVSLFHRVLEELKIPEKMILRSNFEQRESLESGQRAFDLAP